MFKFVALLCAISICITLTSCERKYLTSPSKTQGEETENQEIPEWLQQDTEEQPAIYLAEFDYGCELSQALQTFGLSDVEPIQVNYDPPSPLPGICIAYTYDAPDWMAPGAKLTLTDSYIFFGQKEWRVEGVTSITLIFDQREQMQQFFKKQATVDGAYWIKREANSVVYGFGNWQEYAKAESTQALCEDNGDFDVSSWQKNYPLVRFFAIAEGNYRCVFDGYYRSAACCEQKFIPHTLDVPEEFVLEYGYSWLYPHGYVLLTDYTGDADVVRIPEGVSDISEFVGNRKSMSALIFPEGCRSTGYESFMDCPDLTEVVLPEGIHVGNGSFSHCPKLTHITLPLGTTLDSEGCLYGCITDYTLTLKTGEVFDFRSVYSSDEEWVSDRPDVLTVSLVREEFIANQPGTAKVTGYHSWYDRTGKETKFLLNWHITVIE